MFRRKPKNRCPNLSPSPHPAYAGKRCVLARGHENTLCQIKLGPYRHYWNQAVYERLGVAMTVED